MHSTVTIETMTFKFIPNISLLCNYRPSKYYPFSCYDNTVVMSFRFSNAMACNACHAPEIFIIHTSTNFEKSNTQIFSNKYFFFLKSINSLFISFILTAVSTITPHTKSYEIAAMKMHSFLKFNFSSPPVSLRNAP